MMINQNIKYILILISLINYFLAYDIETISFPNDAGRIFNYNGNKTLKVEYSEYTRFLRLNVKSQSKNNQIISFSDTNENCIIGRKQLIINPYGDINLLIPDTQINNKEKLYICILCQNEDNFCNYEAKIEGFSELNLELNNQYSLYNLININLNIILKEDLINLLPDNSFVIIWFKGINLYIFNSFETSSLNRFEQGNI